MSYFKWYQRNQENLWKPFKNVTSSLSSTDIFHLKRVQTQSKSDFLSIPVDLQAGLSFNGLRTTNLGQIMKWYPKFPRCLWLCIKILRRTKIGLSALKDGYNRKSSNCWSSQVNLFSFVRQTGRSQANLSPF